MSIKKRGLSVFTVILAILFLITGCGSSGNSGETTTATAAATNETSAATTEKQLDPYNIIWYQWNSAVQKDTPLVAEEISKYLKEKINATLTINELASADYRTKMPVIIASGEKFDMCFTASFSLIYAQNALKGAFVNLTQEGLLEKYGKDILEVLDPSLIKGASINGDLYAVPVNKEAAYQWGLLFNKKYVDKYSLDITKIQKLSDAEPLLKTIKENEPDVLPINMTSSNHLMNALPFDFITGGKLPGALFLDGSTTTIFNQYEKPEMKEYFKTMYGFYQAGYIPKDVATITQSSVEQTGQWLMSMISYTPYAELVNSARLGYDVVFQPLQAPIIAGTAGTGAMQAISSTSGDKERTMMFLNLLYSDKTLINMVDFGIENTHYIKKSENVIDDLPGVTAQTRTYNPPAWTVGNQYLTFLRPNEKSDKWDKYKAFNSTAQKAQSLGFTFDSTNVTNQVSQINNVLNQYIVALATGSADPDKYLPEFLDKLKTAGVDDLIKEAQTQFDKWSAGK